MADSGNGEIASKQRPTRDRGHEFQMELVWQRDDVFFSGHIQVQRRPRFGRIVRTGVARGVGWREARGTEVEVGSKKGSFVIVGMWKGRT